MIKMKVVSYHLIKELMLIINLKIVKNRISSVVMTDDESIPYVVEGYDVIESNLLSKSGDSL